MAASSRSVTLLKGVPYCGGSYSVITVGGPPPFPELFDFLQPMLTINKKAASLFIILL